MRKKSRYTDDNKVEHAVILAAGLGSRLARNDSDSKPLRKVGGKSLIRRNIDLLASCGVRHVVIVTGYRAEQLQANILEECADVPVQITFAYNAEYTKSNGISVLCAQPYIKSDFLLMMADHIFEPSMLEDATKLKPQKNGAILCVDYKLNTIFDMDDATKVKVSANGKILDIGKQIFEYNAVDTGLFVCTEGLFHALRVARMRSAKDDCSLSEGVAALIEGGRMTTHDVLGAVWQDVDDEMMLEHAEHMLSDNAFETWGDFRKILVTA